MIISKTPLRISLFGGGTDFPEFFNKKKTCIIGGTIDKFIYISLIKQNLKIKNKKIKLFYKLKEEIDSISKIKHNVIKEAFKKYNLKDSIEMHISSELPSYTGLGSSSSFTVGLLNILNKINKIKKNNYELAEDAIKFERNTLKEFVGYQDQIHAVFGGFNEIEIFKNTIKVKKILKQKKLKILEKNLFLVFTGLMRKANDVEKIKIKRIKKNLNHLNQINSISNKAKTILKKEKIDFKKIGFLLDEMWKLKKKLSDTVTNTKIDAVYNYAKKNGAIGGKLLGAGSGGFMLFYVNNKNLKNFAENMKPYQVVKFKFSNFGSKIYKL
jgi:D-glycero-alpha-D-manno-heptose-7-phosphate kinase